MGTSVEIREDMCGSWFTPSFYHVGSRDRTRVVRLGSKWPSLLSHLPLKTKPVDSSSGQTRLMEV